MPINAEDVEAALAAEPEQLPGGYTDTDSLLYAVAIGMGRDPLDVNELPFVCETVGDKVVPTAALRSSALSNFVAAIARSCPAE